MQKYLDWPGPEKVAPWALPIKQEPALVAILAEELPGSSGAGSGERAWMLMCRWAVTPIKSAQFIGVIFTT